MEVNKLIIFFILMLSLIAMIMDVFIFHRL
jgi:hypothetical protein